MIFKPFEKFKSLGDKLESKPNSAKQLARKLFKKKINCEEFKEAFESLLFEINKAGGGILTSNYSDKLKRKMYVTVMDLLRRKDSGCPALMNWLAKGLNKVGSEKVDYAPLEEDDYTANHLYT